MARRVGCASPSCLPDPERRLCLLSAPGTHMRSVITLTLAGEGRGSARVSRARLVCWAAGENATGFAADPRRTVCLLVWHWQRAGCLRDLSGRDEGAPRTAWVRTYAATDPFVLRALPACHPGSRGRTTGRACWPACIHLLAAGPGSRFCGRASNRPTAVFDQGSIRIQIRPATLPRAISRPLARSRLRRLGQCARAPLLFRLSE